jgi:aryl-phospho-beta-D-glucosidase BglC (GH1 family)
MSGLTAAAFFQDRNIRAGWNMGNTFDSWTNGLGGETYWGNPRVNQDLMNGVKAAGFDIIRIPVTWMGHISGTSHVLSEARLRRVAEVVDMAHNAGLVVIINLHHDGVTDSRTKEDGWLSINKSARNPNDYNSITTVFRHVWEQIASYFQNYGDWLIFEPFNELHDGSWGWGPDIQFKSQFDVLNKWNQVFTDAVRKSGGNNSGRFLVIPSYCTNAKHTLSMFFSLPTDPTPGRQIVSFHYYDPSEFGIQGRQVFWGSEADRQKTIDDFAPFKPQFVDKGVPVIIGEVGAVRQLRPADPEAEARARQSRFDYLTHIFSTARQYGLVPLYWDNGLTTGGGEKFGLLRRSTGEPNSDESRALLEAMINAVK